LAGVRLRDTRVSVRGYRGEQGRSNENQKYGAINTGESIRLPLLFPPRFPRGVTENPTKSRFGLNVKLSSAGRQDHPRDFVLATEFTIGFKNFDTSQ